MNKMKKILLNFAGFLLAILLIFIVLWVAIPKAKDQFTSDKTAMLKTQKIRYVALGDSLTEGVGDATAQGGFVPLFAKQIQNVSGDVVESQNFGKAGDTSGQIYTRMATKADLKKALKTANVITITVGGNDVMHVLKDNFSRLSNLTEKDFKKPALAYQKRCEKIFADIRKVNPTAQIYVLGIYNPFYLNFPNITMMQTIIDQWNDATKHVVLAQKKAYFIPINQLLYKGNEGQEAIEEVKGKTTSKSEVTNQLLYAGDHFHPNNKGYQIMADAVFKAYEKENHSK
ncbi:SGNH/GDSL hydrolase family protein [Lactococcus hircilactis]|uniref:SGNH/GDSL hydrolase family protein n=1 Tax=Lactococcus hircilactis TaxID=1494462 RepID=UPI003FA210A8